MEAVYLPAKGYRMRILVELRRGAVHSKHRPIVRIEEKRIRYLSSTIVSLGKAACERWFKFGHD